MSSISRKSDPMIKNMNRRHSKPPIEELNLSQFKDRFSTIPRTEILRYGTKLNIQLPKLGLQFRSFCDEVAEAAWHSSKHRDEILSKFIDSFPGRYVFVI